MSVVRAGGAPRWQKGKLQAPRKPEHGQGPHLGGSTHRNRKDAAGVDALRIRPGFI
jgi:hypothetical protein